MKIALVTKRLSDTLGGAERVSVMVSRKLAEDGHDVHIITGGYDRPLDNVHMHRIHAPRWLSPWRLISFQRKARKVVKSGHFDLVYGLCQVYPVDIYRVGDGIHRHWMKLQYPHVLMRWIKYMTSLVHLVMRTLESRIIREGNCRFFITNSMLVKHQLIEYFHVPDERIDVIYNGVEFDLFSPYVKKYRTDMREKYRISDHELVLLFVSNNWERKGLSTVIKAMSKTNIENIRLVIAGRGKRSPYLSLAKHQNLDPENLIFTGRIDDVEKYYGMSDIFVLPSRYEPFANVCLEAMACGIPIITTKDNGASELITHGEDGFILDDWRDSDGLAHIIKNLTQADIRKAIGDNAVRRSSEFTWERHIEETNKIFDQLMLKE